MSHVAHMISHSWDAATNLLPHHSHKEGDEAGKSKARPTGDGELSPDEVSHCLSLTFHQSSLPFIGLFTAFSLPFLGLSTAFP